MKSLILGSALSALLVFSAISYSRTFIQPQDPKPAQRATQQVQASDGAVEANAESRSTSVAPKESPSSNTAFKPAEKAVVPTSPAPASENIAVPARTYTATAYSFRGRTSSGRPVGHGLIAADPSVLPMGTRVWIEAGPFTGEYLVADTGGAVRGRRVDIWTPTAREARHFGRRAVKLTVLSFGGKRAKSASTR